MSTITGYHAHVYFDAASRDKAAKLCQTARELFGAEMGRMHERPVGPHPRWSCQLALTPDQFSKAFPWLMLNRDGLTVFTHPETGDDLKDHSEHAIWMGEMLELDLSIFD